MEKLFVDKWFKAPPKESGDKLYIITVKKKAGGRKRGKPCKKAKK